jgi:hypothetical protein
MEWRNAGYRTRIGILDGSVLAPLLLCMVFFNAITTILLVTYALINAYLIGYKNRSMTYMLRRFRWMMRKGVIKARPASYWRQLLD